jgi:hypothetical protein
LKGHPSESRLSRVPPLGFADGRQGEGITHPVQFEYEP